MNSPTKNPRIVPLLIALVVLIAIGAGAAFMAHRQAEKRGRERMAAMQRQLNVLRGAISSYRQHHSTGPVTLADLVAAGELKVVPLDPITGSAKTWQFVREEEVAVDDFTASGQAASPPVIIEVRSGAPGVDLSGKRWADY